MIGPEISCRPLDQSDPKLKNNLAISVFSRFNFDCLQGFLRFSFFRHSIENCFKGALSSSSSWVVLQISYFNSAGVTRNLRLSNMTTIKSLELFQKQLNSITVMFFKQKEILSKKALGV